MLTVQPFPATKGHIMRFLPFLATVAVLAVAAPPASALPMRTAVAVLPTAVKVADAYWGTDACTGRTVVIPTTFDALNAAESAENHSAGRPDTSGQSEADAAVETCTIRVALDNVVADTRSSLCAALVHERGHLHGLTFPDNPADPDHSPSQRNVMAAATLVTPVPCMRAFTPRGVKTLRKRGWKCTPQPVEVQWACHTGRHHRYFEVL